MKHIKKINIMKHLIDKDTLVTEIERLIKFEPDETQKYLLENEREKLLLRIENLQLKQLSSLLKK